jgi:hypothetical protein
MPNNRGNLLLVSDVMSMMAPFAGGSVPAIGDTEYADWIRWIGLGQQDAANRGFWRRLLTKADLVITANAVTTDLPDNFHKVNGIYSLIVDGVDWSRKNNDDEVVLFVETNPTTAIWRIRWLPEAPTTTVTGALWYYFNPPKVTAATDVLFLDGEMIGFYALKEYFRKLKQLGSMDDARIEYENRIKELLGLEMMPSQQEMSAFASYDTYRNVHNRPIYTGRSDRNRR